MNKVGIDISYNKRFKKYKIIKKFLTVKELEIYNNKTNKNKKEFAAGRFAIKEALYKATNWKLNFKDIEILNYDSGEPYILIKGKPDKRLAISLSHEKNYTIGIVIFTNNI